MVSDDEGGLVIGYYFTQPVKVRKRYSNVFQKDKAREEHKTVKHEAPHGGTELAVVFKYYYSEKTSHQTDKTIQGSLDKQVLVVFPDEFVQLPDQKLIVGFCGHE